MRDLSKKREWARLWRLNNPEKARAHDSAQRIKYQERRKRYMAGYKLIRERTPESLEANRSAARERARKLAAENAPEIVAERFLRSEIERLGGMCPKFIDPARRGAPDRMVILPGKPVFFVEMKRAKIGKLAAHQRRYHEDLRKLGHRVWVLWSKVDVEAFLLEATLT